MELIQCKFKTTFRCIRKAHNTNYFRGACSLYAIKTRNQKQSLSSEILEVASATSDATILILYDISEEACFVIGKDRHSSILDQATNCGVA